MIKMKRKILSLLMTAAMITTLFAGMTSVVSAATPDLTITTQTELDSFLSSSSTYANQVVSYEPATTLTATSVKANFAGTFEGNGNSINLNISTTTENTAFIGTLASTGLINNVNFTGSVSATTGDYVAAVVGYNSGIIANVTNSASVTASDSSYVGGIAGYNADQAGIYSCSNSGTITGYNMVGGIAGENDGVISGCSNTGAVNGTRNRNSGIGGITGRNGDTDTTKAGFIVNCYNQGNVTSGTVGNPNSQGSWIGGIIGFQNGLSYCKNCYDTGNIYGYNYVSYIVGKNENVSEAVENCYYLGTASAIASAANPSSSNDPSYSRSDSVMKGSTFLTELSGSTSGVWTQTSGSYPVLVSHTFVVALTAYPTTLTYLEDATFSTSGMAITAVFNNGASASVTTGYTVSPSTLSTGDTGVFVSGTYVNPNDSTESVSYCFRIPVTVNAKPASVTLGPTSSSAQYNTLASALNAVASGGTIEVLGPTTISISEDTQWNNNVTIQRSTNYSGSEPMFTVQAGTKILTLTTMTINGNGSGTLFEVTSGTLRLRGGVTLQNCDVAVYVNGGTLIVNKASITGSINSINLNAGTLTINDFGNTSITGQLFINAGTTFNYGGSGIASGQVVYLNNTSGNSDAYITLTNELTDNLTIQCAYPVAGTSSTGTRVAQGEDDDIISSGTVQHFLYSGHSFQRTTSGSPLYVYIAS